MTGSADLLITGGTIVDGTGAPAFIGDIAITDGRISAVAAAGSLNSIAAKEVYDAASLFVAPGWIDPHTHFDAQYSWDPLLLPAGPAGVTTCIMGNCGIGFAPCQSDRREFLSGLMEAIEDIPGRVIAEGLDYDFETFEEYMDSIERKPLACDVALMIGHCAVRSWVMGKRASMADRPNGALHDPVQPQEIKAIAALVRDAVAKGALGFSSSRLLVHRDPKGQLTPGALAGVEECLAISCAIAEAGGGIFEMSTDFTSYDDVPLSRLDASLAKAYQEREAGWMLQVAREYGKKVAFTYNVPNRSGVARQAITQINEAGGFAKGQSFLRAQGFIFGFEGRMHPFGIVEAFRAVKRSCAKDGSGLMEQLRQPQVRAAILEDAHTVFHNPPKHLREVSKFYKPFSELFLYTAGYEPDPEQDSIEAVAKREGKEPLSIIYDHLVAGKLLWKPQAGIYYGDMSRFFDMMQSDEIIPGFGDAGAHGTMIQDAVSATHGLTHWVRDRSRGPMLPIELVVKKQSSDVASIFGLTDRGTLTVGMRADLNVFDLEKMAVHQPFLIADMPLGQKRWTQEVSGYKLTLLGGVATFRDGQATGKYPGTLVRNPCRDESMYQNIAWKVSAAFDGFVPDIDDKAISLDGFGEKGGSAAARLLREIENEDEDGLQRSKL